VIQRENPSSLASGAAPAQDASLVASKSLVDRLGERLRRAAATEADLRTLDEYRSSFDEAYRSVITTIREKLHKRPSGRPRKTTDSIVAKLKRETIRLSQMQDIAGCRLIVADVREQDRLVDDLKRLFPEHTVIDRRRHPSHGYRAVHVIAEVQGKPVEIQVRTRLQDLWAQLCEVRSDEIDKDLKYGGGPTEERRDLDTLSQLVYHVEIGKLKHSRLKTAGRELLMLFTKR